MRHEDDISQVDQRQSPIRFHSFRANVQQLDVSLPERKFISRSHRQYNVSTEAWKNTNSKRTEVEGQLNVNLPGLENIQKSNKRWHKITWCFAVIVFYSLLCYQLVDRVTLYLQEPIGLQLVVEKVNSVEFPPVILCPWVSGGIIRQTAEYLNLTLDNWDEPFAAYNLTAEIIWNRWAFTRDHLSFLFASVRE